MPCLLPFAANFRFSPQKSGGRSDPTNHNVVLLQGRCAIIEVSLESRSPHTLELLSLDIEVCAVMYAQQHLIVVSEASCAELNGSRTCVVGADKTYRYTRSQPGKQQRTDCSVQVGQAAKA